MSISIVFQGGLPVNFYVIKADGSRQLFDKNKIIKTCMRMGANRQIAEKIADKVEKKLYDGISTKKILLIIFKLLSENKPTVRHLLDLRKGLSLMDSKPEFERFVQILLRESGYEVTSNQIIRGKCIEHEVDAIAKKDGVRYIVEVKHHSKYHIPTGLDETRIARAVFEDVTEGFDLGLNNLNVNNAMIVTNTKFSEHARRYGKCRNILQIGWNTPQNKSLQDMIEKNKLHPFTCLKGLEKGLKRKLIAEGILLIKQLSEEKPDKLAKKIGVSTKILRNIIEKSKTCTYAIYHAQ
jgi:hypothetical protein